MKRAASILSLLLQLVGCGQKEAAMSDTIIKSAEEGIKELEAHPPSSTPFQLAISDSFTFAGKPDTMGAGMAVLMDKILASDTCPTVLSRRTDSGNTDTRRRNSRTRSLEPTSAMRFSSRVCLSN
jgi:hypothetical protein